MSLRKFLFFPLLISLVFFIYFSNEVGHSLGTLLRALHLTTGLVAILSVAILLQLCGHAVRAYKARLIFGVAKESSVRFQFRALSLGYLFDAVLPFRLGELVRIRVISGAMTISFGYALTLVIFERLVDALLLGLLGLLVFWSQSHAPYVSFYVVLLLCLGIGGLFIYYVVARRNKYILKICYHITRMLNDRLKTVARFKAWTIIYGLQRTLRRELMVRYLALSLISWIFYGASLAVVATYIIGAVPLPSRMVAALAPYYGVSIPAGPASLGVFSKVVNNFSLHLHLVTQTALVYDLVAWAVLIVPIALIGFVLLFVKTKESVWYSRPKTASTDALMHKLQRAGDISGEMEAFLDNYFSGNSLSALVHDLEVREDFKLIKYFKGGSDAITILVVQKGECVVKKIIPHEFEDRLKAQYDWLAARRQQGIVQALAEHHAKDYYAIDLAYNKYDESFYEFIHKNTLERSKKVLDETWSILIKGVYGRMKKQRLHAEERKLYIEKHIFGCLEKAAAVDTELVRATKPEKLIINGAEYDNLYQIMEKIRNHKQAWQDIATYRQSQGVHGDVIVDNLLVSKKTGAVLVIDPAPDGNVIEGLVFDFGKLLQSLHCGYETLLRDEEPVFLVRNVINYQDRRSGKYDKLSAYTRRELARKYLTESECRALLFHAGALYIRRLKHQVYYTPANVLKFYAVGVKTLNEFYDQYK